jgi:hypothetical protein
MPNHLGVVANDYLAPANLNFGTATLEQVAQALIDRGLLKDSSATKNPAVAARATPFFTKPPEQNVAVTTLAELETAMNNSGFLSPVTTGVVAPGYQKPGADPATLADLLTRIAEAGYFNNTA